MPNTCAIILAAGEGSRMKTNRPKVLSEVLFKPMLRWVIDAVQDSQIRNIAVVAGFRHDLVHEYLNSIPGCFEVVLQEKRLGTAHAVMMALDFLERHIDSNVLVLHGDVPFISSRTIIDSYSLHSLNQNAATVISAKVPHPHGYGRIVRDQRLGLVRGIVEERDADDAIRSINEVNSGTYWFNVKALLSVIRNISNNNASGEFYLPDVLKLLISRDQRVDAFISESFESVLGANDYIQLNHLNEIARNKVLDSLMLGGVEIPCRDGVLIGDDVKIGPGSRILPCTIIRDGCKIGSGCSIGPFVSLDSALVEDGTSVTHGYFTGGVLNDSY